MSSWPYFAKDEIAAVTDVLKSGKVNYWTGNQCKYFEKEFAKFIGVNHAISLANGTLALELALYALGIGDGDEVITTPRTFIASASAIVMRGANPVLADVDLRSQNITAGTIKEKITPKTKAIIPVHLSGWPCDMDKINQLAKENNLFVIEDCAQAHGAEYKGKPVGSWGDIAAFSFCQDKIITTGGEGGMLVTNDARLWKKAWSYKDHGKDYDAILQKSFGTNWRMTEMQAVIGRKQLEKLPSWHETRNRYATMLNNAFKNIEGLRVEIPDCDNEHAYYKYYVFLRLDKLKSSWNKDRIINAIVDNGVACFHGGCSEIYREKAFIDSRFALERELPNAKTLAERSLMFLVHPTLTEKDILKTIRVVNQVMDSAHA